MKIIFAFILTLALGAQTFNNENWGQQPGGSPQYYFIGNTNVPSSSSAFIDLNNSNAAQPVYSIPNVVSMPFVGTIGNLCVTLNVADKPYPTGSNTFTVWHTVGSTWVPTALSVTVPSNPIAGPVWCNNSDKISPSSGSDMWAIQLTSAQISSANIFTELSFVISPPRNTPASVLTQTGNLFPTAAPGNASWEIYNIKDLISLLPDGQFYGIGLLAPSLSGPGILPLYQTAAGKSGTISNLCFYTSKNNSGQGNDAFNLTLNVNGSNTALTVTVPSAFTTGFVCDNTDTLKVNNSDLLLVALQDPSYTGNPQLGTGTYAVLFTINP